MDWLDQKLYEMKKPLPPTTLQHKLREQFLQQQQRQKRWVLLSGIVCDITGIVLLIPSLQSVFVWLQTINLEYISFSQLLNWLTNGQAQWTSILNLSNSQVLLTSTITATTWIGLLVLAAGTGVNLVNWLPNQLREA